MAPSGSGKFLLILILIFVIRPGSVGIGPFYQCPTKGFGGGVLPGNPAEFLHTAKTAGISPGIPAGFWPPPRLQSPGATAGMTADFFRIIQRSLVDKTDFPLFLSVKLDFF